MKNNSFLEAHLPAGSEKSRIQMKSWQALNENEATDLGCLSDEENLSSDLSPALSPSPKPVIWQPETTVGSLSGTMVIAGEVEGGVTMGETLRYVKPLALFAAGDKLIVFHNTTGEYRGNAYYIDVIDREMILRLPLHKVQNTAGRDVGYDRSPFTKSNMPSVFSHNLVTDLQNITQSVWNSYEMMMPGFYYFPREIYFGQPSHAVGPNAWYVEVTESDGELSRTFYKSGSGTWQRKESFPIYVHDVNAGEYTDRDRWAISHLGRVFAAGKGTVSASNYNSLSRTLDTANEYREANGWAALLSSRSSGGEEITGIASYRSRAVVFKKRYMHEVMGSKNPFRVSDVGAVGCIDHRSIAEVDGILFFVSEEGVRTYTGDSLPELISDQLRVKTFEAAVGGSFGHKYYLWGKGVTRDGARESFLYVYDSQYGVWTKEKSPADEILGFREVSFGFFALGSDGALYRMDSGVYENQTWFAQTDLWSMGDTSVKHIKKAELLTDAAPGSTLSVYLLKDGETFSPGESTCVFRKTFQSGGQKNVRFHLRRGAHVAAKIVISGVGKTVIKHLAVWMREGGEGHATTPGDGA